MLYFFVTFVGMYILRKIGWLVSPFMYKLPFIIAVLLCALWGVFIGFYTDYLIYYFNPGLILKIIMGYFCGCYISIPNFGLFNNANVPETAIKRHVLISGLPMGVYIITATCLAFVPHVH